MRMGIRKFGGTPDTRKNKGMGTVEILEEIHHRVEALKSDEMAEYEQAIAEGQALKALLHKEREAALDRVIEKTEMWIGYAEERIQEHLDKEAQGEQA